MGAVWSALLVGGGLAGALLVWLLRDKGKKGGAEREEDGALGKAASAGGDQRGGSGLSPGPSRREPITKPGAVPSSPRPEGRSAEGCAVRRGRNMPTWSLHIQGRTSPPGQDPPRAQQFPAGAHAPHGLLAFSRSPGDALAVLQGRRPASPLSPGTDPEDLPLSLSWAWLCPAARGAVRAAPCSPLQPLMEQGHVLSLSPIGSGPPRPSRPVEELGLGAPAGEHLPLCFYLESQVGLWL